MCRTYYSYYEVTCKDMDRRAPYVKYPTGLSIYADFREQDLLDMMDLNVKYSGMGSYYEAIEASKSSHSLDLNSRFVCTNSTSTLSSYSKSNSCAISWATAAISAAEYSIQQHMGISTSLSMEYLLTCYKKDTGDDGCNGVSMSDLSDFLYNRGLMTEEDVNRIGKEKMCEEANSSKTYHFESEKISAPNRGGLMNLVASGNPTLTLMSLNLLHLRYTASMNETDYPFTGLTNQPSVYGIVIGYDKGSEKEEAEEEGEGWWMVDVAVTPCEHQIVKLPMKEDENNANFAGIAAYAFSIIPLKREIVEEQPTSEIPTTRPPPIHVTDKEYPTVDSIPSDVPIVIFNKGSYSNVPKVDLSHLTDLEEVVIEEGAFPNATVFRAYGLQKLKRIEIQNGAFPNAFNFDVADSTASELIIGADSFNGQPSSLTSLSSGRRLQAGGFSSVFRLYNNTFITIVHIPSGSFKYTKEVRISGMSSLVEVIIEGIGEKHAPFSNAESLFIEEAINLRNLIIGDKVCRSCSVYSVDSPFITDVKIGSDTFNGMTKNPSGNDQTALEFEMKDRSELQSLMIGKGSFSFFSSFNVNNNPNQHTMLVNVLNPLSRRLQSTSTTTTTTSTSFSEVASLRFDKMPSLKQVEFGAGAFSHADSLAFINTGNLTKVVFEDNTFSDATALEFDETGIEELSIGVGCFNGDISDEEAENTNANTNSVSGTRRLQSKQGRRSIFSFLSNNRMKKLRIPCGSLKNSRKLKLGYLNGLEDIHFGCEDKSSQSPFQKAHSFVADGFPYLRNINLGSQTCRKCSVFSVDSPKIERVRVGNRCFQGNVNEDDDGIPSHRFSITNKPELERTELGRSSFSFFNKYELKSR